MKALKILVIILVVLVAIVVVPTFFMPSEMVVEHSHILKAQPEVIWDQVNCLENWEKWDVWHQDTNMVGTYSGPACGVGAMNSWTYKNTDDGGSQIIKESKPFEYLKTYLDFMEMGSAESEMFLEKVDEGTKLTWNLKTSKAGIMMKWINALMVKPGVTKSYTEGLENLDKLTENMTVAPKFVTGPIEVKNVESMNALAIRSEVGGEGIADAMDSAIGLLMGYAGANLVGPPFSIWYEWEAETMVFDNAVPVMPGIVAKDNMKLIQTYAGKTIYTKHTGSYESTQYSWEAMGKYLEENQLETNGNPFEVYMTNPETEPDQSKWVTELYWPIK